MRKRYDILHITKASSALEIENAYANLSGVTKVKIDLSSEKLIIEGDIVIYQAEDFERIAREILPDVVIQEEQANLDFLESLLNPRQSIIYGISIFFMLLGYLFESVLNLSIFVYMPFYLISYGGFAANIGLRAFQSMLKGDPFNENFLISIATIGAIAIGHFVEAIAVMIFYRIGELLQNRSLNESRSSIQSLIDIQPTIAHRTTNEGIIDVDPSVLKVGQLIIVRPGEKVPVDGIITEGSSWLDTISVTGEPMPRDAYEGVEVISGSVNISGLITVQVQRPYPSSTVAKILDYVRNNQTNKATTEQFMTRFIKYYTPIVAGLALIVAFIIPLLIHLFDGVPYWTLLPVYVERGLVFLLISCPCALILAIPLSYFAGMASASVKGILFKSSNDLEHLRNVDHFVFDKTGTLTEGKFEVSEIVSGEPELILEYAAHAEYHSNHPIARSIIHAYQRPLDVDKVDSIFEYAGKGIVAEYKGVELLVGNHRLLDDHQIKYMKTHQIGTIIYVVADREYLGYIVIKDKIKTHTKEMVNEMKDMGKVLTIVTGDYLSQAMDIAYQLGIEDYYANCLPEDKVQIVAEMSKTAHVAFIGDGINDAPVLSASQMGIAMGGIGSMVAIESSNAVIMNEDPYEVIVAYKISKRTMFVIFQNIVLSLAVKVILLVLASFGLISMWQAIFVDIAVSIAAILNAMQLFATTGKVKKPKNG